MRFKDKIVLITGASRGIGKETALSFAKEGAIVIVNYIGNQAVADQVVTEIEALGAKAKAIKANVASFAEVEEMVKVIKKEFGRIDILVNNAGITRDTLLLRMKEEDFDQVIDINLKGTWNCLKQVTKLMMKQKYGKVISLSSVVGVLGNAGQVNYAASKAGIIGMTKSLARELASRNINVNAVAPGFVQTDMTDVLDEATKEAILKSIPLGKMAKPQDIANTILFLASDEANYITGQTINVDGGMAM